jgi:hypothetical protein
MGNSPEEATASIDKNTRRVVAALGQHSDHPLGDDQLSQKLTAILDGLGDLEGEHARVPKLVLLLVDALRANTIRTEVLEAALIQAKLIKHVDLTAVYDMIEKRVNQRMHHLLEQIQQTLEKPS